MSIALHINLYLCLTASLFALCTALVLTLFPADLSLKYNICSSPGDWLISHGLATTIHLCTGSKTQDTLFSLCSWDPRLPFVFLTEAVTLPRQFTTAAMCSLIKRKSWGTFHYYYYYYYYFAQRLSKRDNHSHACKQSSECSAQSPPNQPAIPKLWLQQIKGAFHDSDSLLEEAVYCWIFRVMVFKADACVGSWAPASNTSLSITAKSWLHRLVLRGQNNLHAQEEAVTCIFALQSKPALLYFFF